MERPTWGHAPNFFHPWQAPEEPLVLLGCFLVGHSHPQAGVSARLLMSPKTALLAALFEELQLSCAYALLWVRSWSH